MCFKLFITERYLYIYLTVKSVFQFIQFLFFIFNIYSFSILISQDLSAIQLQSVIKAVDALAGCQTEARERSSVERNHGKGEIVGKGKVGIY